MTFLSPIWLFAAALAGAVLLLHARRRRRVDVPSVHIWRLLEQTAQRRRALQRPKINLSLILQLLIIALIALMLAQPRIGGTQNQNEHVVFVLDVSGSMRAADVEPSRFEAARDWLINQLAGLGSNYEGRVSVAVASSNSYLALARQTQFDGIERTLVEIAVGDGSPDWSELPPLIEGTLRPAESTRIIILGDDVDDTAEMLATAFPDAEIQAQVFGAETPNVALVDLEVTRGEDDGDWQVTGQVAFHGGDPRPTEISVRFRREGDDRYLDFGVFEVPAPEALDPDGAVASPSFIAIEQTLNLPGPGSLVLALPEDAGPHDNAAFFRLATEPRRLQVLIIGGGNSNLERALYVIDDVDVFRSAELPENERDFDLVIVDDVAVDRQPMTNVVWLDRGRVTGETEPPPLVDAYFTHWDSAHILSEGIDWSALATPRGFSVPTMPGAGVVVEASDNPLLQARTTSYGREVRVSLAAEASDWVSLPSYPVFFANLVRWLGTDLGVQPTASCRVGAFCAVEARAAAAGIGGPDGAIIPILSDGHWISPDWPIGFLPETAGFYLVLDERGAVEIPVNLGNTNESDLSVAEAPIAIPTSIGVPLGQWKWLAGIVLLLLVAEALIAGRGNERFLRRGALGRGVPHAGQRRWQLGLRVGAAAMIVVAIISLGFPTRAPAENLVVIAGQDIGLGNGDVMALAQSANASRGNVGVVLATDGPRVVSDLTGATTIPPDETVGGGNFEAAIALAAAMLPTDRPGRILLASDTAVPIDANLLRFADLEHRDVRIDYLSVPPAPEGEVLIAGIDIPQAIYEGDSFLLNAFVFANGDTEAEITILSDGVPLSVNTVTLLSGVNRVETVVTADEAGQQLFEVQVDAATDVLIENNRDGVLAMIGASPSVLVVTPDLEQGELFAEALALQGLTLEIVPPNRAPYYIEGWLEYELVVLMNVPAIDLTTSQQELLVEYVESHGGGLLITGGESSFGPGGYYQTPLERVSPLSARIPQQMPGTAIVFVLDRSGSMQALVEGTNRLEIAKAATVDAIDLLHEESQVGVVVFDTEPHFIVTIQERKDMAAVEAALDPLQPGGGTELYPALSEAINALAGVDATAKHIVVMTDGLLEPANFAELLAVGTAEGITVSAVAIGGGADVRRAEEIARFGGGAFHATQDFRALPSILSLEAMMLSGTPVEIGTAELFWVDRSVDFLAGLPDQLPPIESYVTTTSKDAARVHLATLNAEGEPTPILASWRFGAGQVVAFASHGAGHGTQNWLATGEFPLFWGQISRHLLSPSPNQGVNVQTARQGDTIIYLADVTDAFGQPLAGQDITLTAVDGDQAPMVFEETGRGRYEARLGLGPGTYRQQIAVGELSIATGVHLGFSDRYDLSRQTDLHFETLALATGGSGLTGNLNGAATESVWEMTPSWRPWAVAALLLFILDLIVRYAPGLLAFRRSGTRSLATANA